MYQIDVATASSTLPAPAAAGTPGFFTDGNVGSGEQPTVVPADFLNAVMLELLNVLAAAGIAPSKTADNQIAAAIRTIVEAAAGNYVVDTGAANAYVVALTPPVTSYAESFSFSFRAVHANTGASQVNFGHGNVPLTRDDGSALQQGDILANSVISGVFDPATGNAMISSIVPSQLGALAKLGIGAALAGDGAGNLKVNVPDASLLVTPAGLRSSIISTTVGANQSVGAAQNGETIVNGVAATLTYTLAQASGLWSGFFFTARAKKGGITLVPNAADKITIGSTTLAAGASLTIPIGGDFTVSIDDTGAWLVTTAVGTAAQFSASSTAPGSIVPVIPPSAQPVTAGHVAVFGPGGAGDLIDGGPLNPSVPPTPISAATNLLPGNYILDSSAGSFTVTLIPTTIGGQGWNFQDKPAYGNPQTYEGNWTGNPVTINLNGMTLILPNGMSMTVFGADCSGQHFSLIYDAITATLGIE